MVRSVTLRLTSLPVWKSLSGGRFTAQIKEFPELLPAWNKLNASKSMCDVCVWQMADIGFGLGVVRSLHNSESNRQSPIAGSTDWSDIIYMCVRCFCVRTELSRDVELGVTFIPSTIAEFFGILESITLQSDIASKCALPFVVPPAAVCCGYPPTDSIGFRCDAVMCVRV